MDSVYVPCDPWALLPQPEPFPMLDFQQTYNVLHSPIPSVTSLDIPSPCSSREDKINGLHEARKQKRREQNKAAQRKFRQKREQAEVELQTHIVDAQKTIEQLQNDNTRLVQQLCVVRKENTFWRSRSMQDSTVSVKEEMAELDAISQKPMKPAAVKESSPAS